jgi:hypothetical protein
VAPVFEFGTDTAKTRKRVARNEDKKVSSVRRKPWLIRNMIWRSALLSSRTKFSGYAMHWLRSNTALRCARVAPAS